MSFHSILLAGSVLLPLALPPAVLAQNPARPPAKPGASQSPKTLPAPPSQQSTHYPILILGRGGDPLVWSVLIGQKGPERFDRANYPPMALDPVSVSAEGASNAWAYHAKDSAAGADVTIHLTREACTEATGMPPEAAPKTSAASKTASSAAGTQKYTFRISVEHSLAGTFNGCARIAAELFPKIVNQTADEDDDADKKKPPVATITSFKTPTAVAFLNPAGKIVVIRGAAKKTVPETGTAADLMLSHDGKKLLFTRSVGKMASERTLVLYEFDSGHTKDLESGTIREPFWSPDDSRFAYLQSQDQKWRVLSSSANGQESASPLYTNSVDSLNGWVDGHTVLASDSQSLYWIGDDRPQQSVALKDIYGSAFQISDSDTIRINPVNPDLLLVSAKYATPPPGATADSSGVFLYEVRSRRRVTLTPPEHNAVHGEWSRDGIQVFYTRRAAAASSATYRIFWDGSGVRRYQDGTELVIGQ
jgi:WD40-like Beta Propeller Repeat